MHSFFAYTNLTDPGLHLWREGTSLKLYLRPVSAPTGSGWVEFQCDLDAATSEQVRFMLFSFKDDDSPGKFEKDAHQREVPRLESGQFPAAVWFAQDASRVVVQDPRVNTQNSLRVHLISQSRFRPGEMYLWYPVTGDHRRVAQTGMDDLGPIFEIDLQPQERSFFNFKFIRQKDVGFEDFFLLLTSWGDCS